MPRLALRGRFGLPFDRRAVADQDNEQDQHQSGVGCLDPGLVDLVGEQRAHDGDRNRHREKRERPRGNRPNGAGNTR